MPSVPLPPRIYLLLPPALLTCTYSARSLSPVPFRAAANSAAACAAASAGPGTHVAGWLTSELPPRRRRSLPRTAAGRQAASSATSSSAAAGTAGGRGRGWRPGAWGGRTGRRKRTAGGTTSVFFSVNEIARGGPSEGALGHPAGYKATMPGPFNPRHTVRADGKCVELGQCTLSHSAQRRVVCQCLAA